MKLDELRNDPGAVRAMTFAVKVLARKQEDWVEQRIVEQDQRDEVSR